MNDDRFHDRNLIATSALLFAATSAWTIAWCARMNAVHGMRMPGGWVMSMTWMRMPGQSWLTAAAWFVGMWSLMMVAMMLPSLVPMLRRYRVVIGDQASGRIASLTLIAGAAYFLVWSMLGALVFPVGAAAATLAMRHPGLARVVSTMTGVLFIIAGAVQWSRWKTDLLACCRGTSSVASAEPRVRSAWRYGLHLGFECVRCCAGLTAILVVAGVMDLRVMAVVTSAITAERLAPGGAHVARATGAAIVATGVLTIARITTV